MKNIQRTLCALIVALALCSTAQAQRGYTHSQYEMLNEARSLLDAGQWSDAYRIYRSLVNIDTTFAETYYGMGMCELNMPDMRDKSASRFEAAARNGSVEGTYQLALARHRQQRFDEEIALLETYRANSGRDLTKAQVDHDLEIAKNAKEAVTQPVQVRIRNMGPSINSSAHDYCPLVTAEGDQIYFTSRRKGSMGDLKDESGQYYEDIYSATINADTWGKASPLPTPVNSNMQDATVGLSPDGNEMIIYRASQALPDGDLFITQKENGQWQMPMRMTDAINSEAHEPSAAISPDGSEIYFSSDRKGGFGGKDLYRIRRLPNGAWSLPLNLGPDVNTPYDEDAPFMHSDGTTLFFSSNGHNTMGGFDIFKASLLSPDKNIWAKPENLGYPLNTVNDDIYLSLSADGRTGYFSSERPGGLGGQDIYQVVFPESQVDYQLVRGVVTDANETPLKAHITLTVPGSDEAVGEYNSNTNTGRYVMSIKPGQEYHMHVTADGYSDWEHDLLIGTDELSNETTLDIPLNRSERTAGAIAQP